MLLMLKRVEVKEKLQCTQEPSWHILCGLTRKLNCYNKEVHRITSLLPLVIKLYSLSQEVFRHDVCLCYRVSAPDTTARRNDNGPVETGMSTRAPSRRRAEATPTRLFTQCSYRQLGGAPQPSAILCSRRQSDIPKLCFFTRRKSPQSSSTPQRFSCIPKSPSLGAASHTFCQHSIGR